MPTPTELHISLWKLKVLGWLSAAFFTFCLIGSWLSGQQIVGLFFIPFILLSIPVLLQAGSIHCDPKAISLDIPLGIFEIEWKEIERVKKGQSYIVFISGDKHLNIPTPEWWAGPDRKKFRGLLEAFLKKNDIEIERSFFADFKFPKNTRRRSP